MVQWMILLLAFGGSILFVVLAVYIGKRNRIAFYLSMFLLAIVAILSVTDQFGLLDLLSLLISLIPLVLLLKDRNWYLQRNVTAPVEKIH